MSDEPGKFLKWAFRYHSLEVAEFDTLDSAVYSANYQSDEGNEALMGIEDSTTGRWYAPDEVWALDKPRQDAEWAQIKNRPQPTHFVEIQLPSAAVGPDDDRKWATVEWEHGRDAADVKAAPWIAALGADRVRIETKTR